MNLDRYLGRTLDVRLENDTWGLTCTVAALDAERVRLRGHEGGVAWVPRAMFVAALKAGCLRESEAAPRAAEPRSRELRPWRR